MRYQPEKSQILPRSSILPRKNVVFYRKIRPLPEKSQNLSSASFLSGKNVVFRRKTRPPPEKSQNQPRSSARENETSAREISEAPQIEFFVQERRCFQTENETSETVRIISGSAQIELFAHGKSCFLKENENSVRKTQIPPKSNLLLRKSVLLKWKWDLCQKNLRICPDRALRLVKTVFQKENETSVRKFSESASFCLFSLVMLHFAWFCSILLDSAPCCLSLLHV